MVINMLHTLSVLTITDTGVVVWVLPYRNSGSRASHAIEYSHPVTARVRVDELRTVRVLAADLRITRGVKVPTVSWTSSALSGT